MLNESFRYIDGALHADSVRLTDLAEAYGTPLYVYSLPRALGNLRRIQQAFAPLNAHIHYSAKANANLSLLQALIRAGAGIDAVSGGEIMRALKAGAAPQDIVFAGVGKTPQEIFYAVEQNVGWFNVENAAELDYINASAAKLGRSGVKVALRLNPEVTANTHPYIATGHGGAKFGLTADTVRALYQERTRWPHLDMVGIHVHIGSQLHDIDATHAAISIALDLIKPYPFIRTVNIGGGLPVPYHPDDELPPVEAFAHSLTPLLRGYEVILEPGRSIIADAGLLLSQVLYIKRQGGETMVITDASMAELIRPALYEAHHEIVPVLNDVPTQSAHVVGPVCETSDVLGRDVVLPDVHPGDLLAILTTGAYGMVMASNYNARLRPAEVIITEDGESYRTARRRESWLDLIGLES